MFIDVHCHLDFFKSVEISRVIENAKKRKLSIILANGNNYESNEKVLELSSKYNMVKAALGLYPIDALNVPEKVSKTLSQIKSNKDKILAVGEVGMDFKESEEKEKQKIIFCKIIELAKEIKKTLIVHSRKAEIDCIDLLEKLKATKIVMHCFSGKLKLVERIIKNNWSLSIPTSVVNSEHFQKIIEIAPIENLLCETDSPYLHPFREFPNEPANVIESYKKIAEIKKLSLNEVEEIIENNFKRIFV